MVSRALGLATVRQHGDGVLAFEKLFYELKKFLEGFGIRDHFREALQHALHHTIEAGEQLGCSLFSESMPRIRYGPQLELELFA